MSLINNVNQAGNPDFEVETFNTQVSTLSGRIDGRYGPFRQFECTEGTFNVDDKHVSNAELFQPNCQASVTVKQYTNSNGETKAVIAGLAIIPPEGTFVLKSS